MVIISHISGSDIQTRHPALLEKERDIREVAAFIDKFNDSAARVRLLG